MLAMAMTAASSASGLAASASKPARTGERKGNGNDMSTDMFWSTDNGASIHIHCARRPKPGDKEPKVIQVQMIPNEPGIQAVVDKVVAELNEAARYWMEGQLGD